MIDPKFIRENADFVRENLKKRRSEEVVKKIDLWILSDKKWRELKQKSDDLRSKRNNITEQIKQAKISGLDSAELLIEAKKIPSELKLIEIELKELELSNKVLLMSIPNVLQDDVPFGESDADNLVVRTFGEAVKKDNLIHHGQLATKLNIAEFERAVKISGEGFYALKGDLALLNLAIVNYAIELLVKKGFTFVVPPAMMKREAYEGVTDLGDFESVMYKIDGLNQYLIATAEHPLTAMFLNEVLDASELPITQVGYSTNFRKEIGKHGLDERGLFRLHQFDKVEQIIVCDPSESNEWLEKLVGNAEELCKAFEVPYRVVLTCTGDIGTVASKKYDIECWSPREGKYFETHSLSNCTTYQSTRLNIKYKKTNSEKEFVHTLNATLVAIPRMLRAIIESHQTKEGTIIIPMVLRKYMLGKTEIKLN